MTFDIEKFMEWGLTEGEKHLSRLANAVDRGESPAADTLQFLAKAARDILNHARPEKALQLEKPQGRKKDDGLTVCHRIMLVQVLCGLMDDHGFTKEQVIDRVAEFMSGKRGFSRSSIERHYDAYHGLARDTNRADRQFHKFLESRKTHKN